MDPGDISTVFPTSAATGPHTGVNKESTGLQELSRVYRSPVQPTQAPYATAGNGGVHSSPVAANSDDQAGLLDIRHAACPANALVSVRLSSFSDWPSRGLPSPRSLVIAGFYYMGAGDSVRCFYCGVTLRNWRETDDPWETHVRFRFSCDYVRAVKGEQFIHQTLVKLATGQRILSPSNETAPCNLEECTRSTATGAAYQMPSLTSSCDSPPPSQEIQTDSEQASPTSTATTHQATARQNAGQPNATTSSQTASAATPQTAASREHPNTGNTTTSQTASAVTSHTTTSREHPSTSNTTRIASSQDEVTFLQGLRETNQRLRQRVTCRLCRSRSVDTIFLPCGHLCTCELCAATITDCCLCGNRIRGTAHVYME